MTSGGIIGGIFGGPGGIISGMGMGSMAAQSLCRLYRRRTNKTSTNMSSKQSRQSLSILRSIQISNAAKRTCNWTGDQTMNEHFRGTLDRAKADLLNRGIGSGYVAPPALRFLWKIGVSIKPPICMTFIGMFTYYSLGFGLGILVIALPFGFNQLIPALIVSPLAGMGFGTIMTIKTIRERRRMDPPSWTEYLDIPDDSHN